MIRDWLSSFMGFSFIASPLPAIAAWLCFSSHLFSPCQAGCVVEAPAAPSMAYQSASQQSSNVRHYALLSERLSVLPMRQTA